MKSKRLFQFLVLLTLLLSPFGANQPVHVSFVNIITAENRGLHNLSQFVSIVIHTRYGKKMLAIQGGIENERETNV